jgi:tripeptidyl-peptidase-1
LTRCVLFHFTVLVMPNNLHQKYHVWQHADSGEYIVRTTSYSVPSNLHEHIDVIQPTTIFSRVKGAESTIIFVDDEPASKELANAQPIVDPVSGVTVDPSCNTTITISCLQQLYNFVGYKPSSKGNSIGITGYLEEFANLQDLQSFYSDQRPDALGTSFKYFSVNGLSITWVYLRLATSPVIFPGGLNDQNLSLAGAEANLDVQFAFGVSHPIPVAPSSLNLRVLPNR